MAELDDHIEQADDATAQPIPPPATPPEESIQNPPVNTPGPTIRSASPPPPPSPQPQFYMEFRCNPCKDCGSRSRCNKTWPSCSKCITEGTTELCFAADEAQEAPTGTPARSSNRDQNEDDTHSETGQYSEWPSPLHSPRPPLSQRSTPRLAQPHLASVTPRRSHSAEPRRSSSPIRIVGLPRSTRTRSPSASRALGITNINHLDAEIARLTRIRQLRAELGFSDPVAPAQVASMPSSYTCKQPLPYAPHTLPLPEPTAPTLVAVVSTYSLPVATHVTLTIYSQTP
jgi:hypothetical protein